MSSNVKLLVATISDESFTDELYETGLFLVDRDSQDRIKRFFHRADSYRCLLGRLLPRLVLLQLGFRTDDITFSRTESGKPFLDTSRLDRTIEFNVSHDQSFVVMAFQTPEFDPIFVSPQPDDRRLPPDPCAKPQSPLVSGKAVENSKHMMTTRSLRPEPITLIGVDVMRIALPRFAKSLRAFVSTIEDTLAPTEKAFLYSFCPPEKVVTGGPETPDERRKQSDGLRYLFLVWTLKEAYTKALGLGLGFDFQRIECRIRPQYEGEKTTGCSETDVHLLIDGLELKDWDLQTCQLRMDESGGETYQVAIARYAGDKAGHPNTLGRVIDRGLMNCSNTKRHPSHLDVPQTRRDIVPGNPGAQRLRSSSDTATEADMDGQAAFGPLGADESAVLRASSQLQETEQRGNDESRALEGNFDSEVFQFQSYDASTVIEIVSALSTLAGSDE